jgi:plasmid stabilization system protein ParE
VGRIVPELAIETIREIILGNYRIIYRIWEEEEVQVVTVHHGARLLDVGKIEGGA